MINSNLKEITMYKIHEMQLLILHSKKIYSFNLFFAFNMY